MEIVFVGVGEAFDENLPNTALLLRTKPAEGEIQILLECGFTAAPAFWSLSQKPLGLDALWISHFHADHFFGSAHLLLRFWEEGRRKPLTIIGPEGIAETTTSILDLAYPNLRSKLLFPLNFKEASPGTDIDLLGLRCSFAESSHSAPCLAVRLQHPLGALFYSGDGSPTEATRALARECDLIVHEAFGLQETQPGHGTVDSCIDLARRSNAKALALVHMNRNVRRMSLAQVQAKLSALTRIRGFLPNPGEKIDLAALNPER